MIRIRRQLLASLAVILFTGWLIAQPQEGTENVPTSQPVSQRPAKQREAYRKAMEGADLFRPNGRAADAMKAPGQKKN